MQVESLLRRLTMKLVVKEFWCVSVILIITESGNASNV